ncbi:MAG: SDR family oxidoreductase, partial [Flavobacteriales bacterium]|nr:SDR family oxidoreductase [Flavobacteriales bacterium]
KIGQLLTKKLATSGDHQPVAFLRKEEQKSDFKDIDTETLIGDLEDSIDGLSEKFKGCDAVVFTAGSGGSTGAEKTLTIDLEGAVRSMKAAEKAGIDRFVMVSAAGADVRELWDKAGMKPYYVAKHYADEMLRATNLDYTILRPVRLTDDEGTGRFKAAPGPKGLNEEITRADVAEAIAYLLNDESSFGKTIEISNGEESIKDAIKAAVDSEPVHA